MLVVIGQPEDLGRLEEQFEAPVVSRA
jgi:hypothetical protein